MIFTSPRPSLAPYKPISLPELMADAVRRFGDKPAFLSPEGHPTTYNAFWAAVKGVASALQRDGLRKGDVVGIYAPNSVEYGVALHGSLLAGATVTTLNPLYREREVEHQLHDAGAQLVFTLGPLVPVVKEAQAKVS